MQETQDPADVPPHPLKNCPLEQPELEHDAHVPLDAPPHPLAYCPLEQLTHDAHVPRDVPPHPLTYCPAGQACTARTALISTVSYSLDVACQSGASPITLPLPTVAWKTDTADPL